MTERWADIPGYEGTYQVSDAGGIRSLPRTFMRRDGTPLPLRGRILTPKLASDGQRLQVMLLRACERKNFVIARLVMLAFVGPKPMGYEVCHNNGNCQDNRLVNLRYGTRKENVADAVWHGTTHKGIRNPGAKLTPEDVRAIRVRLALGVGGEMQRDIAREYGVCQQTISDILHRRRWGWLDMAADAAAKEK